MKFSPFEPGKLISCGRENIRFWRSKNSRLSSCPTPLVQYGRGKNFTCLAFESVYAPRIIPPSQAVPPPNIERVCSSEKELKLPKSAIGHQAQAASTLETLRVFVGVDDGCVAQVTTFFILFIYFCKKKKKKTTNSINLVYIEPIRS